MLGDSSHKDRLPGDNLMRHFSTIVSVVALLVAAGSNSAVAQDYPWCLQGKDWGYPGLCHFSTYNQCLATASATFSYCGTNPLFAFAYQRRIYRRGVQDSHFYR
jgi:hypothetical protein